MYDLLLGNRNFDAMRRLDIPARGLRFVSFRRLVPSTVRRHSSIRIQTSRRYAR